MIEKLSKKLAELREQDKGMSLIELVVVVAILAVLVAIAIPAYLGVVSDAQESAVKSQLQNAYTVYSYQIARGESAADALDAVEALSTDDIELTPNGTGTCVAAQYKDDTGTVHSIILTGTTAGTITDAACS